MLKQIYLKILHYIFSKIIPKYKIRLMKVVGVIDGDTIKVYDLLDNKIKTIRLVGVDAPEKTAIANNLFEYDNIIDLEYLAMWGKIATKYVKSRLKNKYIFIEFDELAGFKDRYGRLLAYVYVNGTDFNAELVKLGLARVYVEGKFKKKSYYLKLEKEAKRECRGVWSALCFPFIFIKNKNKKIIKFL